VNTWSDQDPPKTSPPAAPGPSAAPRTAPEGTIQPLTGQAWRDAVKRAASALHAMQRRQAGRYVRKADRAAGGQYRPGMARREP